MWFYVEVPPRINQQYDTFCLHNRMHVEDVSFMIAQAD